MRFLGLDASTQSLTATVVDWPSRSVEIELSIAYDDELPRFGTTNGVLVGNEETEVHSPPLLWVAALDRIFARLRSTTDLSQVRAITGSGQQHGSVYLRSSAKEALRSIDPGRSLEDQLAGIFSRPTSPIWQDTSTTEECNEIRQALGGIAAAARATGSDVFERFTGPQIRRFWKTSPGAYEETATILLVGGLFTSLLAGDISPAEPGDAAGMSLMDIRRRRWHSDALAATAPGLERRLPRIVASHTPIGSLAPYFCERYDFREDVLVLPFSGDNPCSLIGLGLVEPGRTGISLGTSDTLFAYADEPRVDERGEGHLFGSPTGDYMALLCFQNGSLAREAVRDRHGLDWSGFAEAIRMTPPGNKGRLMLPYFGPEIVPRVREPGVEHTHDLDPADAPANCRAVVEAQMLSMRLHSRWIGSETRSVYVTGGGSQNREILEILADVFDAPVTPSETSQGAALGAALRAVHGYCAARGEPLSWRHVVEDLARPSSENRIEPRARAVETYERLLPHYERFEAGRGSAARC